MQQALMQVRLIKFSKACPGYKYVFKHCVSRNEEQMVMSLTLTLKKVPVRDLTLPLDEARCPENAIDPAYYSKLNHTQIIGKYCPSL